MTSQMPDRDPTWAPERWQARPFTTEMGLAHGVTRHDLYGPHFRQILYGVFIANVVPDTIVVRARAARLVLPRDAVFSHHTAARLLGGPAPDISVVHAAVGRNHRKQLSQVTLHRYTYVPDAMWRHGLPVTTPAQTFIHLALKLDLFQVVAFGDAMVSREMMTLDALHHEVEDWTGQGARSALAAVSFVRAGVDSPPETHLRLLFVLAGLPEPEVDVVQRDDMGHIHTRIELGYRNTPRANRESKVHLGFEYDGRPWHSSPEQRAHDAARRRRLGEEGWHIEVVTGDELYRATEALLIRARDLLEQFGIAVPRHLSDDWRRHFWAPTSSPNKW